MIGNGIFCDKLDDEIKKKTSTKNLNKNLSV